MNSMNIKKGDKVKVLAGKDKGKEGTILRSLPQKQRVVVEKVNIVKKALRPRSRTRRAVSLRWRLPSTCRT